MPNQCIHTEEPYYDILSAPEPSPTPLEINKSRLWQCPDCKKWFSNLGDTAECKNYF